MSTTVSKKCLLDANADLAVQLINELLNGKEDVSDNNLFKLRHYMEKAKELAFEISPASNDELNLVYEQNAGLKGELEALNTELNNLQEMLQSQTNLCSKQDSEINELKGVEGECKKLRAKHEELNKSFEQQAKQINSLRAELESKELLLGTTNDKFSMIEKEVTALRQLHPVIKTKEAEVRRATKKVDKLLTKVSKLEKTEATLRDENASLKDKMNPKETRVQGSDETTFFFVKTVHERLEMRTPKDSHINALDSNWHIEIRNNYGISVVPVVTEWLTPILPPCTEFSEKWTADVNEAIITEIVRNAEKTHIKHVARVEWAKLENLDGCGLTDYELGLLKNAGVNTVFDALSRSYPSFQNRVKSKNIGIQVTDQDVFAIFAKIDTKVPEVF